MVEICFPESFQEKFGGGPKIALELVEKRVRCWRRNHESASRGGCNSVLSRIKVELERLVFLPITGRYHKYRLAHSIRIALFRAMPSFELADFVVTDRLG